MGELQKLTGSAKLCGTVAYVAQTAWIQTKSVRDNILFGRPMDGERAVDAHTASHLFQECVRGALKHKTVVLVTHQVELLHGGAFLPA
ncbi:hypothetical protein R1flu_024928 [Riccia fluitans]|uniref:Uncharacterized protein n=1 Tax=Riccia fluitans TaxID=41844 RepID=A0ABD1XWB3_9MARC